MISLKDFFISNIHTYTVLTTNLLMPSNLTGS